MSIQQFLLKHVINKVLIKYITPGYMPIVVGGTTLHKCSNTDLEDSTDIDIKFVQLKDSVSIYEVIHAKHLCIEEILEIYNKEKPIDLPVLFMTKFIKKFQYRQSLFYVDAQGKKNIIVDMTAFEKDFIDNKLILAFQIATLPKWLKMTTKNIVPFQMEDNIPWADCKWVYLDTIRMIFVSWSICQERKTEVDKRFFAKKTLKYIMKLFHMNVYYRKDKQFLPFLKKINKLMDKDTIQVHQIKALLIAVDKKTEYKSIINNSIQMSTIMSQIVYFKDTVKLLVSSCKVKERVKVIKEWFASNETMQDSQMTLSFKGKSIFLNDIHIMSLS